MAPMTQEMSTLDGNAIGGQLLEVFGTEMTAVVGVCGHCGATARLAELAVYPHAPGTVGRCRACHGLLMVMTVIRGRACVDLSGLADLRSH
jgi:Family of unknown function (DUF6510)